MTTTFFEQLPAECRTAARHYDSMARDALLTAAALAEVPDHEFLELVGDGAAIPALRDVHKSLLRLAATMEVMRRLIARRQAKAGGLQD